MIGQLLWIASPRASCFHAADAVARGLPLMDAALGEVLAAPVSAIGESLRAAGAAPEVFWRQAMPLSVEISNNRRLAEEALRPCESAKQNRAEIAARFLRELEAVEDIVRKHSPRLDDELPLRERPLREQWEARGPGFLRHVAALIGLPAVVEQPRLVLVQPCLGGGGEAHLGLNLVRLEAVLANPWPMLPEALRLGWLLTQLSAARSEPSATLLPERRRMLIALAMLPVALEAGEYVEWSPNNRRTLETALAAWRLPTPPGVEAASLADILEAWRRRSVERSLGWSESLAVLRQMLPPTHGTNR